MIIILLFLLILSTPTQIKQAPKLIYIPPKVELSAVTSVKSVQRAVTLYLENCNFDANVCKLMIDNMQALGFNTMQFYVLWSKLIDSNGMYNFSLANNYRDIFKYVRDHNMFNMVTITSPPKNIALKYITGDIKLFSKNFMYVLRIMMTSMIYIDYVQIFDQLEDEYFNLWAYNTPYVKSIIDSGIIAIREYNPEINILVDYQYANYTSSILNYYGITYGEFDDYAKLERLLATTTNKIGVEIGYSTCNIKIGDIILDENKQNEYILYQSRLLNIIKQNVGRFEYIIWREGIDLANKNPDGINVIGNSGKIPYEVMVLTQRHFGILHSDYTYKNGTRDLIKILADLP
jgi:hypothetical protein